MKPRIKTATARTPDGGEMVLLQHDRDYSIEINGQELMHSRRHESEFSLAELGCAHLAGKPSAQVLIGGLGMGFTLRRTLDLLHPNAEVIVGELLEAMVDWNQRYLGTLNDAPLDDSRVTVSTGDVLKLIKKSQKKFDAILIDIDNGPKAMTDSGNHRLYTYEGIWACRQALRQNGCLAVWSAVPSKDFEQLMMDCGLQVRRYRAQVHKGAKSKSCFIWVASESGAMLPEGGSEPRKPARRTPRKKETSRRRTKKRA